MIHGNLKVQDLLRSIVKIKNIAGLLIVLKGQMKVAQNVSPGRKADGTIDSPERTTEEIIDISIAIHSCLRHSPWIMPF
jgi:hypothetical protein